jgi:hypothetical protein
LKIISWGSVSARLVQERRISMGSREGDFAMPPVLEEDMCALHR